MRKLPDVTDLRLSDAKLVLGLLGIDNVAGKPSRLSGAGTALRQLAENQKNAAQVRPRPLQRPAA